MVSNFGYCFTYSEHILIGGVIPIGHILCQLVGVAVNGHWLSIPHPCDFSGRGTSGGTGQGGGCSSRCEHQVSDNGRSWV